MHKIKKLWFLLNFWPLLPGNHFLGEWALGCFLSQLQEFSVISQLPNSKFWTFQQIVRRHIHNTKPVIVDIKSHFTCGKIKLYSNILPKYYWRGFKSYNTLEENQDSWIQDSSSWKLLLDLKKLGWIWDFSQNSISLPLRNGHSI